MSKILSLISLLFIGFFPKHDLTKNIVQEIKPPIRNLPFKFNIGPTDKPKIALTFDADMTNGMKKKLNQGLVKSWYNKEVIDVLEKENIKATLFLTGMWVEIYPNEAKSLASNPLFEIGSHSYDHPAFSWPCYTLRKVDLKEKESEIDKTQEILKGIGVENSLFRFPGGCHQKSDSDLVNSRGLSVVGWDISSTDAFNQNTASIVSRVMAKTKNGSILVFHLHGGPNAPKTAEALKQLIPKLRQKGFEFVKVSELYL